MTDIERTAQLLWRIVWRNETLLEWHELKPGQPHHRRCMDAAAALADAGLVIAPREPTEAMEAVGNEAIMEEKYAGYVYRAMIAKYTGEP